MWFKYPFYLHSVNVFCIESIADIFFARKRSGAAEQKTPTFIEIDIRECLTLVLNILTLAGTFELTVSDFIGIISF